MRRPRPCATLPAALAPILVTGLLAGCSAGGGREEPAAAKASPSRTASLGFTPRRLDLPIHAYQLSPADQAGVTEAKNLLIAACMKRYGFSWSAPATPTAPRQDRRYGVIDLPAAQRYGYHLLPTDDTAPSRLDEPPSKAETEALTGGQLLDADTGRSRPIAGYTGPVREVDGKPLPPGGCAQEAERELLGREDLSSKAGVVSRINTDSFTESLKTPAVKDALGEWSACMRKAGYDYADPLESIATARLDSPEVPAAEIELATADVTCKDSVGLVDVWNRAESAIQRRMIEEHASATARQRADNAARVRNAAAVTGASEE
ncbi:hypothetical protein ACFY3N_31155 [Streptomyces sp. NPDC000348]|uniref:hypothetical protein n=1 Tax=Streptomyces sp. NPDC000348 TaxID=3364538 RepID=UPI0036A629EC